MRTAPKPWILAGVLALGVATVPGRAQGPPARGVAGPALRVSEDGRHLVRSHGTAFFWLGDTAWLLSQMTTRDDAELYLKTRAEQGFTVIQAALVMGEERVGGTLRPNKYGDLAFRNGDPARPALTEGKAPEKPEEYDYWDHADYLVERARAHGLTLALLPLFVGYAGDGYKYLTPENAEAYGRFLGRRYGAEPHIVWVLGGDNTPDTEAKRLVWERLARGITIGAAGSEDYGRTIMTYHINGGNSSSRWFHAALWLDFNMVQVWGDEKRIYPKLVEDRKRSPARPTGLGEGSYEDGPQYPTRPIDARKVRRQAYWSYLAGGYHTYGNTNTWNFGTYKAEVTADWKGALRSPGAASLSVLSKLFASLKWWELVPDQSLFATGAGDGEARNLAMRSADGGVILAYMPAPATISLDLRKLAGAGAASATWIDPRTGARTAIGEVSKGRVRRFATPEGWPDAVLLIEGRR
ncbi:MAG: glycoside hydrolase family 140 protein [Planctomycetia bacterium]|nr:glycoside hydrolase family 140 protein [Planctomycetia bacterium]